MKYHIINWNLEYQRTKNSHLTKRVIYVVRYNVPNEQIHYPEKYIIIKNTWRALILHRSHKKLSSRICEADHSSVKCSEKKTNLIRCIQWASIIETNMSIYLIGCVDWNNSIRGVKVLFFWLINKYFPNTLYLPVMVKRKTFSDTFFFLI